MKRSALLAALPVMLLLVLTVPAHADWATDTLPTDIEPRSVAVNPATNKIYVANYSSGTVTVIDGATNAATAIAFGSGSVSIAVNLATNKAFAVNSSNNIVAVINGTTLDTAI